MLDATGDPAAIATDLRVSNGGGQLQRGPENSSEVVRTGFEVSALGIHLHSLPRYPAQRLLSGRLIVALLRDTHEVLRSTCPNSKT